MASAIAEQYQRDFYSWLLANARLLREGRYSEIDAEHLAEELEGMGRSEKRALVSRLTVLLVHAEDETGVAASSFPEHCPYTPEQILDRECFPETESPGSGSSTSTSMP